MSDHAHALAKVEDNNFIMTGAGQYDNDKSDLLVMKINQEGGLLWSKSFGNISNYEEGVDAVLTRKKEYAILGNVREQFDMKADILLVKMDNEGRFLWSKAYGNQGEDLAQAIKETPEGGLIIAGNTATGTKDTPISF